MKVCGGSILLRFSTTSKPNCRISRASSSLKVLKRLVEAENKIVL